MPTSTKGNRRLTGYRGNTDYQQSLYDDDMDDYQHYNTTGDDEVYEEYDEDLDDDNTHVQDDQDDTGSELSIPDPNIDFDMVYALHTFAATVEGQASVVRGDALTLLDDSNSYWWLIKVLKTAEVGYIPAENIETPHERLARLNSHRNIELTRKDIQDAFPAPPSNSPKKTKRVTLAKGVQFQSQIIYGSSDDDEDDYFEAEFEQWDERMRSDESDTDDMISEDESDDPYRFYGEQDLDQPIDMYTANYSQMNSNPLAVQNDIHPYQNALSDATPIEADSDIINDALDPPMEDETIKISLTPSIARSYEENHRNSDSSIQNKLKKAAKLEKLLNATSPEPQQERRNSKEKKEKSSIRKFFSRSNSSSSKESKKSKKHAQKNQDNNALERQISAETASISSQSTGMMSIERDRVGSIDSANLNTQQPSQLKINAGNITDFGDMPYKHAYVYPSTTANELIQQVIQQDPNQEPEEEEAYHDYHLIVRTLGGDEFTLVPSDKPLEIFHSLTAHLNTPMPSLKKARRISALMGSDNTYIGGPSSHAPTTDEEVQFYLYSKTKRTDDGEIQIKVSLFEEKRTDKLVKIASHVLVKDAVPLLLEKFHILNGIFNGMDINSLRLDGGDDVVKYSLAVNRNGQEQLLDLNDKLLDVFGDQVPPIQYRRNSNPDRTSITVNINPPDKDEVYFILKCVEQPKPIAVIQQEQDETSHHHDTRPHHRLVRQDTPMPIREATPTGGFQEPPIPSRDMIESPDMLTKPVLSSSPDSEPDIMSQLDEAIDTLAPTTDQKLSRHEAAESMLFCNDFGMNDMMVIIRGAAQKMEAPTNKYYTIRSEISDVFKDSQTRLEQLEKELDRIMAEAVKVHQ